jgi:hydrogenase maturation protease
MTDSYKRTGDSGHVSAERRVARAELAVRVTQQEGRTIIVGLGNPLLTDDAVGPRVAGLVHDILSSTDVDFRELAAGGVELMETVLGYKKAVIIDAILTDEGAPGTWYRLDLASIRPTLHAATSHEIGLLEGLDLGRCLGLTVPDSVRVYAVKIVDPFSFGTKMTDSVERVLPRVAKEIAAEIRVFLDGSDNTFQV